MTLLQSWRRRRKDRKMTLREAVNRLGHVQISAGLSHGLIRWTGLGRHLRWTLPTGIRWVPDPQRRSGVGWWKQSVPGCREAEARRWRWPGKLAWPSREGQTGGAPGYLRAVKEREADVSPCKFYTAPSQNRPSPFVCIQATSLVCSDVCFHRAAKSQRSLLRPPFCLCTYGITWQPLVI